MTPHARMLVAGGPPGREPVPAAGLALVIVAGFAAWLATGNAFLADPDSYWHVHVGRQILATGQFPTSDSHSYSQPGAPWIAKEWLSQVILALAHQMAGWTGLVLLSAASATATLAIVALHVLRRVPVLPGLALVAIAGLLLDVHAYARPHLLAAPVMAAWFALLIAAAEEGRAPHPLAIPLMALWANLHGSFIFGLAFGGLLVVEAVLKAENQPRVFAGWALVGGASAAAALLHPYGIEHVVAAFKVMNLGEAKSVIMEWRPTSFADRTPMLLVVPGLVALGLAAGRRLPWIRAILVILLMMMALQHVRHMLVLGIVGAMLVTPALAGRASAHAIRHRPGLGMAAGAALMVPVAAGILAIMAPYRPSATATPTAALSAVAAARVSGRVVNDYHFGGYLIASGIPTLIDGRTELFGPRFTVDTVRALSLRDVGRLDALLDDPATGWTLLAADNPAVGYLDRRPGWRRLYGDDVAVVHVRTTGLATGPGDTALRPGFAADGLAAPRGGGVRLPE